MVLEKLGTILKGIGGFYYVHCEDTVFECKAGGRLRKNSISPCAGDIVTFEMTGETGLLTSICTRKNYFVRPPIANVDKLFVLASEAPPVTDFYLIDRMSVISRHQDVDFIVIISKNDVSESSELKKVYTNAGIKVISCSAVTLDGIDELKNELVGHISVFSGNSGIGKSSLLNALYDEMSQNVGAISEKINRGKQTTRTTELFPIKNGGFVADTPGFSSFDITKMQKLDKIQLEFYFEEFMPYFGKCRFSECRHLKEPDCALKAAVERGDIERSRYDSYVKLMAELSQIKEWK